jgi:hypothetical protein
MYAFQRPGSFLVWLVFMPSWKEIKILVTVTGCPNDFGFGHILTFFFFGAGGYFDIDL